MQQERTRLLHSAARLAPRRGLGDQRCSHAALMADGTGKPRESHTAASRIWWLRGWALKQGSSGTASRPWEAALARLLVARSGAPVLPDEFGLHQHSTCGAQPEMLHDYIQLRAAFSVSWLAVLWVLPSLITGYKLSRGVAACPAVWPGQCDSADSWPSASCSCLM